MSNNSNKAEQTATWATAHVSESSGFGHWLMHCNSIYRSSLPISNILLPLSTIAPINEAATVPIAGGFRALANQTYR